MCIYNVTFRIFKEKFMRINFDSSYNDITKIFRAFKGGSEGQASSDNSFSKTLGDIFQSDNNTQIVDNIPTNSENPAPKSNLSFHEDNANLKNMFALNLEDFKLERMDLAINNLDYTLPEYQNYGENLKTDDVKTPTIVSAKRIPTDNNLSHTVSNNILKNDSAKVNENFKINVDKIDKEIISKIIKNEGQKQGIDPALALAVAKVESSMNPMAVSSDGHYSKGLFQLLDSTGKELMANFANYDKYSPYDAEQNTSLGVNYLRELHQTFSDTNKLGNNAITSAAIDGDSLEKFAVAAFNAGKGRVASAQEKAYKAGLDPRVFENVYEYLPNITKNYVKRVMEAREEFSKNI